MFDPKKYIEEKPISGWQVNLEMDENGDPVRYMQAIRFPNTIALAGVRMAVDGDEIYPEITEEEFSSETTSLPVYRHKGKLISVTRYSLEAAEAVRSLLVSALGDVQQKVVSVWSKPVETGTSGTTQFTAEIKWDSNEQPNADRT